MTSRSDPFREPQAPKIVAALKAYARVAACIAILSGVVGLLGWIISLSVPIHVRSRGLALEPDAALAFTLAGFSLWLRRDEQMPVRTRRFADAFALVVLVIGLFALLQAAMYGSLYQRLPGHMAGFSATSDSGRTAS